VYNSKDGGSTWSSQSIAGSYKGSKTVSGVHCSEDGNYAAAWISQDSQTAYWEIGAVWYYSASRGWWIRDIWTPPTQSFSCSKDLSCIALSTTGYTSYYTQSDALACTGRSGNSPLTSMKVDSILGGQASSNATTVVAQSRSGNTQIWAQSGYVFITYTKSSQEPYPTYAATLDTGSRDVVITAAAIDGQSSSFCCRPCPLSSPSPSQFFPLVKLQQTHSLRHQLCRGNQL
jgi:hypothetical protein